MRHWHIPRTWTAEQALAVSQFLQQLLDDIWDVHGDEMLPLLPAPDRQLSLELGDREEDWPF